MDTHEKFRNSVLRNFFTEDGRLKQIPAQMKRKLVVFEYLVSQLREDLKYTEKEINEYITRHHEDYCTIRREFIIKQFMTRENNMYQLNPKELWADWRVL